MAWQLTVLHSAQKSNAEIAAAHLGERIAKPMYVGYAENMMSRLTAAAFGR